MERLVRLALVASLAFLGACADMAAPGIGDPDGGASFPDAAEQSDGGPIVTDADIPGDADGPSCFLGIVSDEPTPPAPGSIRARGTIAGNGTHAVLAWRVFGPHHQELAPGPDGDDPNGIKFYAGISGTYRLELEGALDGIPCEPASASLEVSSLGTEKVTFRLHYTPARADDPPAQERDTLLRIGTAEVPRIDWQLLGGELVSSTLSVAAEDRSAQITIRRQNEAGLPVGEPVVLYAGADGAFRGKLAESNSQQSLLIVPFSPFIAPYRYDDVMPADLASPASTIAFDPGQEVSGTVLAAGVPVARAAVSVAAGDLPPALTHTDDDGRFFLRARSGPLRVEVAPARGSGLAALRTPAPVAVRAGQGLLTVTLPPAAPVLVSGEVVTPDGVRIIGGRVTFVATASGAGSVQQGAGAPIAVPAGETRVHTAIDGAGRIVPVLLPAADYRVIVEPPVDPELRVTLAAHDLRAAGPQAELRLVAARPTPILVTVVDDVGEPVANARIDAVARGRLGVASGDRVVGFSTDDVKDPVPMKLAPGMDYELVVEAPPALALARQRVQLTAADVASGRKTVTLAPAVVVRGKLLVGGTSLPRGRVAARCVGHGCPGFCETDACKARCGPLGCNDDFLYGETVARTDGTFELLLPDLAAQP